MCNFVVKIVAADGLAPLGTRTSAGTVITNFMHKNNTSWHSSCIESISLLIAVALDICNDIHELYEKLIGLYDFFPKILLSLITIVMGIVLT